MTTLERYSGTEWRILTPTSARTSTVPDAPTGLGATPGDGGVDLAWEVPDTGGSAITGYTVTVDGVAEHGSETNSLTVSPLNNGTSYEFTVRATNAVGDSPESEPITATPSGSSPVASMGPSGQWPAGFPAYDTAADITTNGTESGLASAISSLSATGGVIQHAGDITDYYIERASGTAEIVIRPPLGQRAEYTISGSRLRASNVCVAGFTLSGSFRIENAQNAGAAWCEGAANLWLACYASAAGETTTGFAYEVVTPGWKDSTDRCRVTAIGAGASSTMTIVGSWLTGSTAPPPEHADTIQVLNQSGGDTHVYVSDSVLWPSWDKVLQGDGEDNEAFTLDNVWLCEPGIGEAMWDGTPVTLEGFHAITAVATLTNCVLGGSVHTGSAVTVSDSQLYNADGVVDAGGNTILAGMPEPPACPNHAELDSIWST